MKIEKLFASKLKAQLNTKADDLPRYPAVIGDGYGNVFFGSSRSAVYVRIGNQLSTAICTRVQATDGLAVWVGYANEEQTLYQVLSLRTIDAANANNAGGYAPANRYRYLAKGGGQDPLWLELRAWLPLRVGMTSPASTSVSVYEGNVWSGTEFLFVASQDVDLSSHIPATSGKAAWVLLTVDNTGAIVDTKGSEVDIEDLSGSADVFENAPSIPADTIATLALVRVYEGQTEVREGRATLAGDGSGFTDIIDLRGIYSAGGVVSEHNDLSGLQGGTTDEYYHLTAAEKTVVENTSGTNTGDQTLSWILIADTIIGAGGAASFDFTSIPATYKHLKILITGRTSAEAIADTATLKFNGDTGNKYYHKDIYFYGTNSVGGSQQYTAGAPPIVFYVTAANTPANIFAKYELTVYDYANTATGKSYMSFGGDIADDASGSLFLHNGVGAFTATDAINQITITKVGSNFVQYSRATLYGLK